VDAITWPVSTTLLESEGPVIVTAPLTQNPRREEEGAWTYVVVERVPGVKVSVRYRLDGIREAAFIDRVVGAAAVVEERFDFDLNPPLEVWKFGYWLKKGKPGRSSFVLQLSSSFIISTPISPTSSINVVRI
jgi:hypothetical protein